MTNTKFLILDQIMSIAIHFYKCLNNTGNLCIMVAPLKYLMLLYYYYYY